MGFSQFLLLSLPQSRELIRVRFDDTTLTSGSNSSLSKKSAPHGEGWQGSFMWSDGDDFSSAVSRVIHSTAHETESRVGLASFFVLDAHLSVVAWYLNCFPCMKWP